MKTDADIRLDVQNELQWDPSLDDRAIGVNVHKGVVTLIGAVAHYADRLTAEDIAKRVAGVQAIANDIEVKMPTVGERSDPEIAEAAASALKWNLAVGGNDVKAVVKQGWITLSGQATWEFQRIAAENAIHYLRGVKGVSNDISIKPNIKAVDVKQKIKAAFQRQAALDTNDIDVKVDDTEVTLKGHVHTWSERDDAARAAWAAPGVAKVDNQLVVQY